LNNLNISINYITNFKPSNHISENFTFSYKNKKNIIICKNFLAFMYLINHLQKKNNNIKVFLKPTSSSLETLLRAPYRHKISRHQITFSRYYFVISFKVPLKFNVFINNFDQLFFLIKELKNYFVFFETNICYTHSCKIRFNFYYNEFFKIMNYK
jgi:hypothetical protein